MTEREPHPECTLERVRELERDRNAWQQVAAARLEDLTRMGVQLVSAESELRGMRGGAELVRQHIEKVERERDELRARVVELEDTLQREQCLEVEQTAKLKRAESALRAVREAVEKASAHEQRILDACERGDPSADPSAILYAYSLGFRAVRDLLRAKETP